MRDMKRRLALTVAGSSALVAITAGAAIAANLGILTASSSSNVGQLDATKVAELAVATPASIDARRAPLPVVDPAPDAPVVVSQPSAISTPSTPAPAWAATQDVSASEAPAVTTPSVEPVTAPPVPSTQVSESDETDHVEGSLDEPAQDDAFAIETPHHVEAVTVSEKDN